MSDESSNTSQDVFPGGSRLPPGHDVGLLLLRIAVGGLMLFHGIDKLRHGIAGEIEDVAAAGLPEVIAYGVYLGEVVAPILLMLGLWIRPAAGLLAFTMVMAIYLTDGLSAFTLGEYGGLEGELPLLYLLGATALFFTGAGRLTPFRSRSIAS